MTHIPLNPNPELCSDFDDSFVEWFGGMFIATVGRREEGLGFQA